MLYCSCKCLDALQVISLVTEGSLDILFLKKMLCSMDGLPRTVRINYIKIDMDVRNLGLY